MKYSIIIPTAFDKCESLLVPCIESIKKYTDLSDTEIIVVSNGCTDNTVQWCAERGIYAIVYPNAMGYPAAINSGIRKAEGEFIVLLNNDTILLPQPKNQWLDILNAPFIDSRVAISGPWKNWCPYAERHFLIFFCVMLRKAAIDSIGMLDTETFTLGYGEDCDWCCRAEDAGWRVAQVPTEEEPRYDGRMACGNFPIYHAGNQTFKDHPDEQLIWRNRDILEQKYATNIGKAKEIDGFMSVNEMRWLAKQARTAQVVVEVGSWHGRSTRALADNLPANGKLYAIDTWKGSAGEQNTNHASAKLMDGDHALDEFSRGLFDLIQAGKVIPIRMRGKHGAKLLQDMGVKADLIFIDGGHGPGEVKDDIINFLPILNQGGIICGHDYKVEVWPCVTTDVLEMFGPNVGHADDTSIWYTNAPPIIHKSDIYDCFPFNNELDILSFRLQELYPVVDRFVIVESTKTHSGKPKELVFDKYKERFERYLHKITYIVVEDTPEVDGNITDKSWARERHQRDAIMRGLTSCKLDDVIIVSDADEIPAPEIVRSYTPSKGICSLSMDLFYYNMQTKAKDKWNEAKILPYSKLKELGPCGARYAKDCKVITNAGLHLSYFGGVDRIIEKISNTAHQEYNTPEYKDPARIARAILECKDLFGRDNVEFVKP